MVGHYLQLVKDERLLDYEKCCTSCLRGYDHVVRDCGNFFCNNYRTGFTYKINNTKYVIKENISKDTIINLSLPSSVEGTASVISVIGKPPKNQQKI